VIFARELVEKLALTDEQRERIRTIREKQERAAIQQRAKLETARLDLRQLLRGEKPDRAALDAKIDEIARLRAQDAKARIGTLLEIRGVLTPEQQQKLRSLRDGLGSGGDL